MRATATAAAAALMALLTGCATAGGPPVFGRTVRVSTAEGTRVQGELLAVASDELLVGPPPRPERVAVTDVREVRVTRHGWNGRRGLIWSLVGAAVTGGAMAAACASCSECSGCTGHGVGTAAVWLVVGGLASMSMEYASRFDLVRPNAEQLRPYARFPQGLPEGFLEDTPPASRPAPAADRPAPRR